MSTDHVQAGTARAQDLQRAAKAFRRAEETANGLRAGLHKVVAEAVLKHGMSKSEAGRLSGYTREYVAKICDDYLKAAGKDSPASSG